MAITELQNFDPSNIGLDNGNFGGLPFDYESADLILFPVPWEVTVSYQAGTALGPAAVIAASRQLDLYDFDYPEGWKQGIFVAAPPDWIAAQSETLRQQAIRVIEQLEQGDSTDAPELQPILNEINQAGQRLNQWLFDQVKQAIVQNKRIGVIGGDHSVPLGAMQALATQYTNFGILHIDAHSDLRCAYEGFQFSHASIMYNALQIPQVSKLVQVGIRDTCEAEVDLIRQSNDRAVAYYDPMLKQKRYAGVPWLEICQQIVAELPQQVYVSFDVDGLDPKLCPHTGTPVPGGLELEETFCLFREVIRSGRQIIGFDVSEVGNDEWDGNVAARAIYKLANLSGLQGL